MQTLLNQLVYFGFFQSILLLAIYTFSPSKRKFINGYLALFVAIITIGLLGKVLHTLNFYDQNFRLTAMSEFSALLFGPTVYLFSKSILEHKPYEKQDIIHYLPGVVYGGFILFYFIIPADAILSSRAQSGELSRAIYTCHAVGLIVNIAYYTMAIRVFTLFDSKLKNEVSFSVKHQFMTRFMIVVGVCLFVWLALFVISLTGLDNIERNARPYIWILLSLVILFITYYGMVAPSVLRIAPESMTKKYVQSKLSLAELEELKLRLDQIMLDKKPYLSQKLLKAELAELLGISNPELARLLNESIGMNFFEYVNYYRIREFINLSKTDQARQLTFFGLAQKAGFNSKTTFNTSFKKIMGSSPSVYFNQDKKL